MKTALLLLAIAASVSAHGRLTKPTTRDMLLRKRDDEMNAPVPGDSNFICRNYAKGPNQATLTAGGSLTFQWSYSAAHVGDCSAYLSYDGERTWFKIWNMFDCKSANGRDVQVNLPSYLPACASCVLRWEWIALHQWPGTELYAQCVDVQINGNGNSLPNTYAIPGHLPPPSGNNYRNPFGTSDTRIAGPAIASGPGGVPVPPPTPGPGPAPNPPPAPTPDSGSCYSNPGLARDINGPINQQCSAPSRCPNEQCCSRFGFCGTSADHCNGQSTGDWRTKGCNVPTGQCLKTGQAKNLDGPINANSACGQNAPGSRCPVGNCCSQFGFCGTSDAHCNQNQGDWRLVPCSGANNIQPRDNLSYNNNTSPLDLGETNGLIEGNSAGQLAAVGVLAVLAAL